MKVVLLRVGIDKVCGGIHSPIFKDGTYEFVPIPEYYYRHHAFNRKHILTYSNYTGQKGVPFIEYFKAGKDKKDHEDCPIHLDPDFETFTYGDGNYTKQGLLKLDKGDFLIFYTMMEGKDIAIKPGMYVLGYFEVDYATLCTSEKDYERVYPDFENNFHIKNKEIFLRDITNPKNKGLKLVKGTQNSRKLKYAYLISRSIEIPKKSNIHVISDEMLSIFGAFGGKIAIQKDPLRWIKDNTLVESTVNWLKKLE